MKALYPILLALILLAAALAYPFYSQPAQAQAAQVLTVNSESITGTTNYDGIWLEGSEHQTAADIFVSIDQTDVNTITLTLQVSADGVTFVNHSASSGLVTANEADADSYTAVTIHGKYYRIAATVTNENAVTPTIKMVLR